MFQNVTGNGAVNDDDEEIEENKINLLLKELFAPHNWVIYILTFLLSMIKIKTGVCSSFILVCCNSFSIRHKHLF